MGEEIIDLNIIAPPKRIIKVKDKEIDVSVIPFKTTIKMMKHSADFQKLGQMVEDGSVNDESEEGQMVTHLETMFEITKDILNNSDKSIDDEWVDKNLSGKQVIMLINKIMGFVFEEFGEPKKALKPQPSQSWGGSSQSWDIGMLGLRENMCLIE